MTGNTRRKRLNQLNTVARFVENAAEEFLKAEPYIRLLDIGCGDGFFEEYLCGRYGKEKIDITVTDINNEYLNRQKANVCVKRTLLHDLNSRFPFEDGVFDLIIASAVIGALQQGREKYFFKELRRLLVPSGQAVIFASNRHIIFSTFSIHKILGKHPWRHFNPKNLKELVQVDDVEIHSFFFGSFISFVFDYLIGIINKIERILDNSLVKRVSGGLAKFFNWITSIEYRISLPQVMSRHFIMVVKRKDTRAS
jgi:SAM-dependent methyltransferase